MTRGWCFWGKNVWLRYFVKSRDFYSYLVFIWTEQVGGVPGQVSCHVSSEAPARLSYLGFPHYLKVEGSYDAFRKPKWKEDAITLGYILLMAAQNKLRWRTDAHGHRSKLWRLILRGWMWIPGRSLVVSLVLPGVCTASVMAWCKTNAHNFCFSPFFIKAAILLISFS